MKLLATLPPKLSPRLPCLHASDAQPFPPHPHPPSPYPFLPPPLLPSLVFSSLPPESPSLPPSSGGEGERRR
eukprot:3941547-Rhodomonas_salina.1